ncbi:MAG: prepilin-type N-terminal cleavage/methylation domain-containing protein [Acidimicrobiia bacterium]|nr:prepilin-type N-terminal cleavage/methylation domain-containing protein [Acidimicrobiia bacterium]
MGRGHPRATDVAAQRRRRAGRRGTGRRGAGESGLTLIELMVAITVFAIAVTGIAAMANSGLNLARNNRNRSIAANLASEQVDAFRSASFEEVVLDVGQTVEIQTVNEVDFELTRQLSWVDQESESGACDVSITSGLTPRLLRVVVDARWTAMGGIDPVRSETVLTPPIGQFDPTKGNIAVRVFDREAGPGHGHPVTVAGPDNPPQQVTINDNGEVGCAFFPALTPGTYTVTMGTAAFVDRQGVASPQQTIVVSSGTVSSVQFDYDMAAGISATLTAPGGGNIDADVPLTIGNNQILPLGTRVMAGSGTVRPLSDLFPFSDGYELWAGSCADADAEGVDLVNGGPYWPGGVRAVSAATDPGVVTNTTVELESLDVTVTRSGLEVPSATVARCTAPTTVANRARRSISGSLTRSVR